MLRLLVVSIQLQAVLVYCNPTYPGTNPLTKQEVLTHKDIPGRTNEESRLEHGEPIDIDKMDGKSTDSIEKREALFRSGKLVRDERSFQFQTGRLDDDTNDDTNDDGDNDDTDDDDDDDTDDDDTDEDDTDDDYDDADDINDDDENKKYSSRKIYNDSPQESKSRGDDEPLEPKKEGKLEKASNPKFKSRIDEDKEESKDEDAKKDNNDDDRKGKMDKDEEDERKMDKDEDDERQTKEVKEDVEKKDKDEDGKDDKMESSEDEKDGKMKIDEDDRNGKMDKDDSDGKMDKDDSDGKMDKDDSDGKMDKDDSEGKMDKDDSDGKMDKIEEKENEKDEHEQKIRFNFDAEVETLINKQINQEFKASYIYLSMSSWFASNNQALSGFAQLFKKNSDEERMHGNKLMMYMVERGGTVEFQNIEKPDRVEWDTPTEVFEEALELEKSVFQSLIDLHTEANKKGDAHLTSFLETFYLDEQVKEIKKLGDMLTMLDRAGDGLGLHIFDQYLLKSD